MLDLQDWPARDENGALEDRLAALECFQATHRSRAGVMDSGRHAVHLLAELSCMLSDEVVDEGRNILRADP